MAYTDRQELSAIKAIELEASKLTDVVSLAQGIPSFDTPDYIKSRVKTAIDAGLSARYSLAPGILDLRAALADMLASEGAGEYDPTDEVLITAGSIAGITSAMLTLLRSHKDAEVLLLSPGYVSHASAVKVARGIPVFVPLNEDDHWQLDIARLEACITQHTKVLLITNPNNPTGTVFDHNTLSAISRIAKAHNLWMIIDEVYKDFVYNGAVYARFSESDAVREQTIIIGSFSKAYAMTGWRVGYLAGPRDIVKEILKVHDTLVTCAPVISQYAALAALQEGAQELTLQLREYEIRRNLMVEALANANTQLELQIPHGAYFLFPKLLCKQRNSWEFALGLLHNARVAVVPGSAFGPTGEGHIRLCFGRSREDIIEGCRRLSNYLLVHSDTV